MGVDSVGGSIYAAVYHTILVEVLGASIEPSYLALALGRYNILVRVVYNIQVSYLCLIFDFWSIATAVSIRWLVLPQHYNLLIL
jgi:hypothetical protein